VPKISGIIPTRKELKRKMNEKHFLVGHVSELEVVAGRK